MDQYRERQHQQRDRLYAAHQRLIDVYWDDEGHFIWPRNLQAHGGYRAILWHCLSYLAGDAHCVEKANKIIIANYTEQPCHFTPGASLDVLVEHGDKLVPEARQKLEQYIKLNLPYMWTHDLRIYGYNDNHPYKAIHDLVIGGEMFDRPEYVERGIAKMREAKELFQHNGFPCEFNSPNYTEVSLNPLANIVEHAHSEEARELALTLERFYWQDLALHFDPRSGLPAGPYSRGYANDYSGLLSGTLCLLLSLFPERFDIDLVEEGYVNGETTPLLDASVRSSLPFFQAHPIRFITGDYHLTEAIEEAIFTKPAGAYVRGLAESGTAEIKWKDPETRPAGAPSIHHVGPRSSLLTTYFGQDFTLGTSQYSWLDNGQANGFLVTVSRGKKTRPQDAALYYSRMFTDKNSPFDYPPADVCYLFREEGESRAVQHKNTAMVFYNPHPITKSFKRLQTGIFRPIYFSTPEALYVGDVHVTDLNFTTEDLAPIAIQDGNTYLGFVPLRLTDLGQARQAHLSVHTYGDHLSIAMSSFEGWGATEFTYEDILSINAGFVCEAHAASDFASFAAFREWLTQAQVSDRYYAHMRVTTYQRPGLKLSANYSPYHSTFSYATVNNVALPQPVLRIEGIADPGYGLALGEETLDTWQGVPTR